MSSSPASTPSTTPCRTLNVAIIGSGVSGLTAASLLSKFHNVTLFERESKLGMDAHSIPSSNEHGHVGPPIDVPLRMFNPTYYPNLTKLYQHVGVRFGPTSGSISCAYLRRPRCSNNDSPAETKTEEHKIENEGKHNNAYFRYENLERWFKFPLPWLHDLTNPKGNWIPGWMHAINKFGSLFFEFAYFSTISPIHLKQGKLRDLTLGSYLNQEGYSTSFTEQLLYPVLTIVCTCSYRNVAEYPAEIIVTYNSSHFSWFPLMSVLLGLKTNELEGGGYNCRVLDGVCDVVEKLSKSSKVVLNAKVLGIKGGQNGGKPCIEWTGMNKDVESTDPAMREALSAWNFESSKVVVHTDVRFMPQRREDWSPMNIMIESENEKETETENGDRGDSPSPASVNAAMGSIWISAFDKTVNPKLIQTWNPLFSPLTSSIIATSYFERPLLTHSTKRPIKTLAKAQGTNCIYCVGAYSLYSLPLLENGVRSAVLVSKMIGELSGGVEMAEKVCPWGDVQFSGDRLLQELNDNDYGSDEVKVRWVANWRGKWGVYAAGTAAALTVLAIFMTRGGGGGCR